MINAIRKQKLLFILTLTIGFGCQTDDIINPDTKVSYLDNIANIGTNVITETYLELANKALILHNEVVGLEADRTVSNLDITKNAWRDARVPWELSEGFLFGPVDTKAIDPSIDSWPVNKVDLDNVLASNDELTETYIDALIGELKGFHVIEYLLWGEDGNKQIGDFTDRQFEYLLAVTENLAKKTNVLANSWSSEGDNFVLNFTKAGTSESIYVSERGALQELVQGLVVIADEVANGKIGDPFSQQDLNLEESKFSHNSKNDFANNIRSISNVYNGKFNISGPGIYDIVKSEDSALADRLNDEINEAIVAIDNIPGTFSDAIFTNKEAVQNAQNKVAVIKVTFESDVMPLINEL